MLLHECLGLEKVDIIRAVFLLLLLNFLPILLQQTFCKTREAVSMKLKKYFVVVVVKRSAIKPASCASFLFCYNPRVAYQWLCLEKLEDMKQHTRSMASKLYFGS